MLEALAETGTPLVTVFMAGRPLTIERQVEISDAVLYAWHPGTMGGKALSNIIFGAANPSGKLPVTFPRNVGQIPIFYYEKNTGRPIYLPSDKYKSKYLDSPNDPLYPFGHGLSYTDFKFCKMKVEETEGGWNVTVNVRNIGKVAGKDVVQLYVKAPRKGLDKPERELKGFAKTPVLNPGESYNAEIFVSKGSLTSFDEAADSWKLEKGTYTFIAAKHSLDNSLKAKIAIK